MNLRFDNKTLQEFKEINIREVLCCFIQSGCAGTKIQVIPVTDETDTAGFEKWEIAEDFSCFIKSEESSFFKNAFLTRAQGKWILSSPQINTRCSCGSSFSLKTGDKMKDAIAKLRALKKKSINHNEHETS